MTNVLLRADELHQNYGSLVAVNNFSANIHAGELVGLLGPNGAGKSTTLRMLTGLLQPSKGRVAFNGYDITDDPIDARRQFGYVAEQPMIIPYLTGIEYVEFVAGMYGIDGKTAKRRAEPYIERFHLTDAIHKRADKYSHGMQQKLALTAQLVHEPRLLLADEPTVGLDPDGTVEMQRTFREYVAAGNSILLSTHLLDMAEGLCNRVLILSNGILLDDQLIDDSWLHQHGTLQDYFFKLTREN
ncbi:MAG: ABC transporter ATP-binding protein [Acidimicrobiaceae bacterium]|nr:ABC transporter ATP-binding protein [Acidimicrobiaceae bacterium]